MKDAGKNAPHQGDKLPEYLSAEQLALLTQKTPAAFVKKRPGPGGEPLNYVEIGYVVNLLNQVFGYNWDFIIVEQQVGRKQVWVRGELSVRAGEEVITKSQYGGAEIRFNAKTGQSISIADDLKAAASDCLKKCASLFGVAGDIYWPDLDNWNV
jgi:hypothetical protein